jgi:hypothetical protein
VIAQHRAACEVFVRDCINACMAAKDERGRWRPQAECERRLELLYGPSAANEATAAAARRLGAWLAGVGK